MMLGIIMIAVASLALIFVIRPKARGNDSNARCRIVNKAETKRRLYARN